MFSEEKKNSQNIGELKPNSENFWPYRISFSRSRRPHCLIFSDGSAWLDILWYLLILYNIILPHISWLHIVWYHLAHQGQNIFVGEVKRGGVMFRHCFGKSHHSFDKIWNPTTNFIKSRKIKELGECFRFGRELLWTDSLLEEMCNGDFKIGSMLLSSCLNRFFFFWFSNFPKDLWIYLNLMNIGKTAIQLNYSWIKQIYIYWIYFACVCQGVYWISILWRFRSFVDNVIKDMWKVENISEI